MAWNPTQYEKFHGARLQPGLDLLHRVPDHSFERILDLGTGNGPLIPALKERFPQSKLVALDNSKPMLDRARESHGDAAHWVEADMTDFTPEEPFDLVFSNSVLHWLPRHAGLFPKLLKWVKPGGVLAVQMPRNFAEPSHQILRQIAAEGHWADRLSIPARPVLDMPGYWDLLSHHSDHLDLWETQYLHQLTGDDPVYEWTKGTAMTPVLDALTEDELAQFTASYKARLKEAYPVWPGGVTFYPFRRIFMVAVRKSEA